MQARELRIGGAFEFTPDVFPDQRGLFTCPYLGPEFTAAVGYPLTVAQTNHSVSARGVLRGLHFADVPPGQAKYLYCPQGGGLDVLVDLRVGSPTFGEHDVVELDDTAYRAVFIPEGVGHAFFALRDNTLLSYLCSTGYNPGGEHGINPLDPELGLPWPTDIAPVLSAKDAGAPSLAQARAAGLLPDFAACQEWYAKLRD